MGKPNQQVSAQDPQTMSITATDKTGKKSNGKNDDDQLLDEVNKLDQIRDMLFGEHVASLKNEYKVLDKNLDQNVSVLRKELATSIEDLKQQMEQKFAQLQKSLQVEETDRIAQHDDISSRLSSVSSDIMTKIDLEAKKMDQALNDQYQESSRQLNQMVDTLQDAKVDRKSLAALFSQFAKELEGS